MTFFSNDEQEAVRGTEKMNEEIKNKKANQGKRFDNVILYILFGFLFLCILIGTIGFVGAYLVQKKQHEAGIIRKQAYALEADSVGEVISSNLGYFTVEGGIRGTDYTYVENVLMITTSTPMKVVGNGTNQQKDRILIYVSEGLSHLTVQNVQIELQDQDGICAFEVAKGGLELSYEGDNRFVSGRNRAGIETHEFNCSFLGKNEANLYAEGGYDAAGIGSSKDESTGVLFIDGGTITAIGGRNGAGIGAGNSSKTGKIEIENATVFAYGGTYGAGIGGGNNREGMISPIYITNSNVTAFGGDSGAGIGGGYGSGCEEIQIENSTIHATSDQYGAGIGGGNQGSGRKITITGSNVTSIAGIGGAGIGGGYGGMGINITISGGEIIAKGGEYGAGIGGGFSGSADTILITNQAVVEASGGNQAAGIGSGNNIGAEEKLEIEATGLGAYVKNIRIENSQVYSQGGENGAGIGGGNGSLVEEIVLYNATITATGGKSGAGIGGGNYGNAKSIEIENCDVTSTAGSWGAGIGGGNKGALELVVITSSVIRAYGGGSINHPGTGGAGIGGGNEESFQHIVCIGSSIIAKTEGHAAGIGAGGKTKKSGAVVIDGGSVIAKGAIKIGGFDDDSFTVINSKGETLKAFSIVLEGVEKETKIQSVEINYKSGESYPYEVENMQCSQQGELVLYLPKDTELRRVETKDGSFVDIYEQVDSEIYEGEIYTYAQDVRIKELFYEIEGQESVCLTKEQLNALNQNGQIGVAVQRKIPDGAKVHLKTTLSDSNCSLSSIKEGTFSEEIAECFLTVAGKDGKYQKDYAIIFCKDVDTVLEYISKNVVENNETIAYEIDGKRTFLTNLQKKDAISESGVEINLPGTTKKNSVIQLLVLDSQQEILESSEVMLENGIGNGWVFSNERYCVKFRTKSCNTMAKEIRYSVGTETYSLKLSEIALSAGNQGCTIQLPEEVLPDAVITVSILCKDEHASVKTVEPIMLQNGRGTVKMTVVAEDSNFFKNYLFIFKK